MRRARVFRFSRRQRAMLLTFSLISALLALFLAANAQLRPILISMATSRVSNAVTRVVSEAVNETIYGAGVDYDRLISFEKDGEGRITALKSNMAEFNRLQSAVVEDVLQKLSDVSTRELSIPVGSLTGSALLAGRGPYIRVRMQSVGATSAHFENDFASSGINQTRHQISLVVEVTVSILLPGFSTATKVTGRYSVAETVIVGSVPETYTYFKSGDDIEDLAGEYIMNNG